MCTRSATSRGQGPFYTLMQEANCLSYY